MLPRNLFVPLIGLCLYSQANNLNLCNNTAMMIIILALIIEQKEIEDLNGNGNDYSNGTTRSSGNNTNSGDTYTYNYGNQRSGYYDNGYYNNGYYNNGCCCNGCNTANNRSYNGYYPYPFYYPYGRSGNGYSCCNNCGCNTVVY